MISPFVPEPMSPKDKAKYGAALAKAAAFDAVQKLWRRRSSEGWTQVQVANAIGVDEGWLSKQFIGPRNWTMETFGALVVGLNGEAEVIAHAMEDQAASNYDAYAEMDEVKHSDQTSPRVHAIRPLTQLKAITETEWPDKAIKITDGRQIEITSKISDASAVP